MNNFNNDDDIYINELVKIGLFNIYDGYLDSKYGSNDILKHIISVIPEVIDKYLNYVR